MSLVSNIINTLPSKTGSAGESQGKLDLNDTTFSDLLEKRMNVQQNPEDNWFASFGTPAIFGAENGIDIQDLVSAANKSKDIISQIDANEDGLIGSSEMVAFLTKPFDSKGSMEHNLGLMNFAKRQAAGFYNKCASNVVTDLQEFVEDTLKLS